MSDGVLTTKAYYLGRPQCALKLGNARLGVS